MSRLPDPELPPAPAEKPHPDRLAATLAQRAILPSAAWEGPFQQPGLGSADARVDLKLAAFAAREAVATRGTEAARARLREVESGPDLAAGTVQDGTARGLLVAYEEAISLCAAAAAHDVAALDDDAQVFTGKELRRKKDILVASAGSRIRFSRKGGIHYVDRARNLNLEDCVRFEGRRDAGTLDGFTPHPGERARLFSPAFLKPVRLVQGTAGDRLELEGRLGRRPHGFPCRIVVEGRKDEASLRFTIAVQNVHDDHRLRIRLLGFPDFDTIGHRGTPAWEIVQHEGRRFVAATLVRACGRLLVEDRVVAVPGAQCHGWITHELRL